jgi:hypothetical protein
MADLLYSVPLIVAVSLVYAGTRHEAMSEIMQHAWRVALWFVGFMLVVMVLLMFLS